MSKLTYAQKLLDPRWQKRRLERLEAAGWTCSACGDTQNTLHVHHRIYRKNADPWDYSDDELDVLCVTCHDGAESDRKHVNETMALAHCECLITHGARAINPPVGSLMGPRLQTAMHRLKSLLMSLEMMQHLEDDLTTLAAIPEIRAGAIKSTMEHQVRDLDAFFNEFKGAVEDHHETLKAQLGRLEKGGA